VRYAVTVTLLSAADTERNGYAAAPQGMYTAQFDYILITPYLRCRSGKKLTCAPGLRHTLFQRFKHFILIEFLDQLFY
jgi:hypothetical protein